MAGFSADISFTIDRAAVDELLRSPSGPVGQEIGRRGQLAEEAAKGGAPVDTGELAGSISLSVEGDSQGVTALVGVGTDYWMYQEFGTIYVAAQAFMRDALNAASG